VSDRDELAFLGEEFLTWLWFRTETEGGDFEIGSRAIAVLLDDYLAFAPRESDETEQTLRKGTPSRTAEARAALRNGHRVRRAKFVIAEGSQEWTVTIDGPTMNLLSVKVPDDDEEASDPRERSTERIRAFLDIHEIVGLLYKTFLQQRLRTEYLQTSAERQAQWMAEA